MTNATDIEEQAMEWLVRLDALDERDGPAAVRAQFDEWCASDPRRHAAYIRLESAWGRADRLRRLAPPDGAVDIDLLAPPAAVNVPRRRFGGWPAALAAALALVAAGVGGWFTFGHSAGQAYSTGIGGYERLLLSDGSTVELDTDSKIRVRFDDGLRHIALLRGRANFKVAPDARRSFEVDVGGTTVRALGTVFSVRLREHSQVEVLVTEGRVAIGTQDDAGDSISSHAPILSAGEGALIKPSRLQVEPVKVASGDIGRELSWTQGRLTLEGETLREAVGEFNRYNARKLVIDDESIAAIRVGGSFQPTDPESFLTALERSFGVRVSTADANEIHLVRAAE